MAQRDATADAPLEAEAARRAAFGWGDGLALLTTVVWAAFFPVSKPIVAQVHPFVFVAARFWIVGIGLLIFASMTGQSLRLRAADLPALIGLAVLGFGLVQSITGFALALTTASKGAVIMATAPVFGAMFARLMGERSGPLTWAGLLIAFAGVFLVINNSLTTLRLGGGTMVGDLLFLIVSALFALYTALSRNALIRHGSLKAGGYITTFGAVSLMAPGYYGYLHGPVFPENPLLWINFLFVALISGVLGFAMWYTAIARIGVTRSMLYYYLIPVFAVVGSVLFLHEPFSVLQAGGGALVLAGVALARRGASVPGRKRAA